MDQHPAIRVSDGKAIRFLDTVIQEGRFSLYLNDELLTELVASRDMLRELGAGFVITEGIAETVNGVEVKGESIWVEADAVGARELEYRSSGGCGVKNIPRIVNSDLRIHPEGISVITAAITSDTWKKTGGVHCSVLFRDGEEVAKSSDIGRHNTVDKVVGYAELNGIDRTDCCLGCTGRQPGGMVSKCANAGIPIIVSRSASTSQGILTAEETGIALICFSRENRFTIYSHPERIFGIIPNQEIIEI